MSIESLPNMSEDCRKLNPQLKVVKTKNTLSVVRKYRNTESEFSKVIEDLLTRFGWRWIHSRPGKTSRQYTNKRGETKDVWVTPLSGSPGFPDYFAVRGDRALAIELKSDDGKLLQEQRDWLEALADAGIATYVWRPSDDINKIAEVLR